MAVREVTTAKDLKRFIRFPMTLHRGDPNFVPHLLLERRDFFNPKKNPFFEHAEVCHFLYEDESAIKGRISAIVNHAHNEFHQDRAGFFGFFDCTLKNISRVSLERSSVRKVYISENPGDCTGCRSPGQDPEC